MGEAVASCRCARRRRVAYCWAASNLTTSKSWRACKNKNVSHGAPCHGHHLGAIIISRSTRSAAANMPRSLLLLAKGVSGAHQAAVKPCAIRAQHMASVLHSWLSLTPWRRYNLFALAALIGDGTVYGALAIASSAPRISAIIKGAQAFNRQATGYERSARIKASRGRSAARAAGGGLMPRLCSRGFVVLNNP